MARNNGKGLGMRQGISLVALVSALALVPLVVSQATADNRRSGSGQCRKPAALPVLPAETAPGQQQGRPRGYTSEDTTDTAGSMPADRREESGKVTTVDIAAPPPPPVMAPPPPPPPPPPAMADAREAPTEARPMPEPMGHPDIMPPSRRPQPWPQAGILTAGEHDDLLNPELYAHYQRRSNLAQEIPDLPVLDTARVLTVELRDAAGTPVGRSVVEVLCADGNRLLLPTMADGTVTLFPGLDRLSPTVKVRALGQDWRSVAIAKGAGGQRVTFTGKEVAAMPAPKLDLVLVIDTTGSMGDEIRYLQSELGAILNGIRQRHPGLDLRVGFVFYRDIGDDYVTHTVPLTHDFAAAQGELAQHWAGGGGDYPEAMDQALIRAAGQPWRSDAAKTMLLVADAPPHDDKFSLSWQASEVLRHKRVQIVPVAASGVADKAEYALRAMAALTQSRYTFLTDDSGVGNAHAAPAIDCYLVTRLNSLLMRVIGSQLSGRRIEPAEQDVIRTVGKYDNGKCVIPPGGLPQQ